MNDWIYYSLNSQRFKRGFDEFAFPSVDAAWAYINKLSANKRARMKIYKRVFSSGKCVVYDPVEYRIFGNNQRCLIGLQTCWIHNFAVSEN